MGEFNLSTDQIQMIQYVAAAVVGVILFVTIWRRSTQPIRRRKTAGMARQLDMDFIPRLRFSEIQAAYGHTKEYSTTAPGQDIVDAPNKLHIEGIANWSVLNDPRFFNQFNTSQIRNYCRGLYNQIPVEIFDWQQSRRRNDRSARGPKSTVVVFYHATAHLPWLIAFPSIGASRRKLTNSIEPSRYPQFNTVYQLQAPDGHPGSESRILSLMGPDALKMLVESSTVRVWAAGDHLLFSRGNVVLSPIKINELLEFGIDFYQALDR